MAKSKTSGQGRPKGVPNKLTVEVKDMVRAALDSAGGEKYLVQQAKANPKAFLTLVAKLIPNEVTGKGGGAIQTQVNLTVEQVRAAASAVLGKV